MNPSIRLKQISSKEFALLGMNDVAYVKRLVVNDEASYAIHTADGTQVAVLADFDVAIATIRQHDLEPLSLH
jgi:hypothetical protein